MRRRRRAASRPRRTRSHIGEPALTEGSTIYSGDYVSTEDGGSVLIRIGESSLELQSASAAQVYRTPFGAVVELNHGPAFFTTPGGHEMRVGSESHSVEEGKAYRVHAVNEIS